MSGPVVPERVITPSSITAWLDCAHFLGLEHQVQDGLRPAPSGAMGSFAHLLLDKGLAHEADCLAEYERQGRSVLAVPDKQKGETFAAWVTRVGNSFDDGYDVIYQMPFVHNGIRGVADFLIRVVDEAGVVTYEPVDSKLAREAAKPGHVLQLCFYADAIEASTGRRPARMHLWLGSGRLETLLVEEFGAYWRRLRAQLAMVMARPTGQDDTRPEPCEHCAFCEFADVCEEQWREEDSLVYVAGLRSTERIALEDDGVATLAGLAEHTEPVPGIRAFARSVSSSCRLSCRSRQGRVSTGRRRTASSSRTATRTAGTASTSCPSPTTATCSSTSRATRSGVPTAGCSSCSA